MGRQGDRLLSPLTKTKGSVKTNYTFDKLGRLTGISGSTTASYTYDGNGIRTSKTVGGVKTTFVNDGGNVFGEISGSDIRYFTYGDRLLYMVENGTYKPYCYDINGNILAIAPTGSSSSYYANYSYDAFGNTTTELDQTGNPFRYKGEYYDDESDMNETGDGSVSRE